MVRKGNSRKLLSTEREELILRCIAEGIKTVGGLVEELNVSEATVRRDLENLEQQGLLRRVHGGAELVKNPKTEPVVPVRNWWMLCGISLVWILLIRKSWGPPATLTAAVVLSI